MRGTARAKPELKFTSLLHHVNENLLAEAFFDLKKTAMASLARMPGLNDSCQASGSSSCLLETHQSPS